MRIVPGFLAILGGLAVLGFTLLLLNDASHSPMAGAIALLSLVVFMFPVLSQ